MSHYSPYKDYCKPRYQGIHRHSIKNIASNNNNCDVFVLYLSILRNTTSSSTRWTCRIDIANAI
eukprot:scaffold34114_cov233-Skeletonema_dohrnii-CCMP3373.AAC.1